ncbi:hypothetical protein BLA29_008937, partial [Euroglyphus maynei]
MDKSLIYCLLFWFFQFFIINSIDGHFHETQFPKSYGHVHQLQPPMLNLSYASSLNDEEINPVTVAESFDVSSLTTTTSPSELFAQEDGSVEQSSFNNENQQAILTDKTNVIQYVWNVYNFSDILYSGQDLIFSPRFYLSEPGYRLQMLLITNTTYSDMVSYLGVFFRIVAGDYDSEVEWPYKYRTVLSVLKHEELDDWTNKAVAGNLDKLHTKYNHTIIPNLDECRLRSAFLRPNSDIEYSSNTDGCGNRRHIPLMALESDHYLKDDTLILLLTVYLDNDFEEKTFHKA